MSQAAPGISRDALIPRKNFTCRRAQHAAINDGDPTVRPKYA